MNWRNRIVGYGEEVPDQLLANPRNFRIHPQHQQKALSGVLDEVGWVSPVLVNQRTGFVIDGHLRVAIAISKGEKAVPVTYVDLSEAEEALILATFDPLSSLAVADKEQLDALLKDVQTGDEAVSALLTKLRLDTGLDKFNPMDEWQGMPDFKQEDKAKYTILVHFLTWDDVQVFSRLVEQPMKEQNRHTRFIWFPAQEFQPTPVVK